MRLRVVAREAGDPGAGPDGPARPEIDAERLLAMALAGDPRAPVALFDCFEATVNRLVWRVLGADEAHDDVVHQVFVALLAGLRRVRDTGSLEGWVVVVTINTVRSEIRRRRIRRLWLRSQPEAIDRAEAPEPMHEARELLRRTYAVLAGLPANERIAFTLRFIDEQPLTEVAAACGCSLATIKRRLVAARARFRRLADRDPALAEVLRGSEKWSGDGSA
jgi:RNA polymerase sigma-70 factor (ECF subfamily)